MKKIALITDAWKRFISYSWPAGIIQRLKETDEDVNLYIFNSFGNWSWDKEYNLGEYNIYKLPDLNEFDGIILDINLAQNRKEAREIVFNAIKTGKPIISIGDEIDGCYYVGIDNYMAMTTVMSHLYEVHDCRNFWFIMGPKDNFENTVRVRAVQDFMSDNGLLYKDLDFRYESFDYSGGYRGFKSLLNSVEEGQGLPDAVICGNDNIAIGVIEAASAMGYKVPTDFRVTGFDDIERASYYSPKITTVGHIKEEIGYQCADIFIRLWAGRKVNKRNYTPVQHIYWDSCGCKAPKRVNRVAYAKSQIMNEIEISDFEEQIMALEYDLSNCKSIAEISECIPNAITPFKCDAMFIVLDEHMNEKYKNGCSLEESFCVKGFPKKMYMEFAYDTKKGYMQEGKSVRRLFPTFDYDKGCTSFLFLPIHFKKYTVGYVVIRNADYLMQKQYVFRVMNMLATTIKNLYDKERLEYVNKVLEDTSVKDAMTGLYNRNAYDSIVIELFEQKKLMKQNILVMFIDMDKLKYINDTFGHDYGDIAIKIVADAINRNCGESAIAVRNGGDEFVIFMDIITNIEYEKMIATMRREIADTAKGRRLPFDLGFSVGAIHTDMNSLMTIEDYIRVADEMMYEEKVLKKANRKD